MTGAECGATINLYGYPLITDDKIFLDCLSESNDDWHSVTEADFWGCDESEDTRMACSHHLMPPTYNKGIDGYFE